MPNINIFVDILGNWVHQFLIEALRTDMDTKIIR